MQDYYHAKNTLLDGLESQKKSINVPILEALGAVLSGDLLVKINSPVFDNSAMDGYALCDMSSNLTHFKIIGRIAAGFDGAMFTLKDGEACRIFTGAPIPNGCTTVVMQEYAQEKNGTLSLLKAAKSRQNIRFKAEELAIGETLLKKGHRLDPAIIALLASQGIVNVPILKPLNIAIFSTGNELIEPELSLNLAQIYDANRYQLLAWMRVLNIHAIDGKILPDDLEITTNALKEMAQKTDVIILSGGASVGEEDYVKTALESIGSLDSWKVAIKPGKPFGWGRITRVDASICHVFLLPGNPVAAYVTFYLLVYPALLKLQGIDQGIDQGIVFTSAIADFKQSKLESRREYLRGSLFKNEAGFLEVKLLEGQGSAMLFALSTADALIEIPPNTMINKGDIVRIYPLPRLL